MTNCTITIVFHSSQVARGRRVRKNGVRIFFVMASAAAAFTCREQRPICLCHGWVIEATGGGLPGAWEGFLLARRQAGDISNHEQS
jgi:hypothetical protein